MTSRLSNNDRLLRFAPRKIKNKNKYKLKRNQLNRATSCLLANHACAWQQQTETSIMNNPSSLGFDLIGADKDTKGMPNKRLVALI